MIDGLDFALCFVDELLKRERLRRIRIRGRALWVRTRTPDLDVAASGLYFEEYRNIRCAAPQVIIDAGANIGTSAIYFASRSP